MNGMNLESRLVGTTPLPAEVGLPIPRYDIPERGSNPKIEISFPGRNIRDQPIICPGDKENFPDPIEPVYFPGASEKIKGYGFPVSSDQKKSDPQPRYGRIYGNIPGSTNPFDLPQVPGRSYADRTIL